MRKGTASQSKGSKFNASAYEKPGLSEYEVL